MMNLNQAIAYGKQIGVKYYVKNSYGHIVAGAKTLEQAQEIQRRYELDRQGPYSEHLHYRIEMA